MSNFSASIPVANMQAANAELEASGHGPNNFSIPAYSGEGNPSVALLHAWGDPEFEAAVAAIPGVVIIQGTDPIEMTRVAAESKNAVLARDAKPLVGIVSPGLYIDDNKELVWVKKTYDTKVVLTSKQKAENIGAVKGITKEVLVTEPIEVIKNLK